MQKHLVVYIHGHANVYSITSFLYSTTCSLQNRTHTKNPLIFCDSPFKKITLDVCDPTKSTALKRGKFSKRKNREGERAAGLCPRELARTATRGRRCQGKEVKSLRNRGTKFFFFYRHFLLSHPLLPVITVGHLYLHRIPTVFLLSLSLPFTLPIRPSSTPCGLPLFAFLPPSSPAR